MREILYEFIIVILILAVLVGCKRDISKKQYNQLKIGMEYKQVVELFGRPNVYDSTTMGKNCTWGNEKKYIFVNFVDGKMTMFLSKGF